MSSPRSLAQLERQLKDAKQAYANAMSSLDDISREIHMKRAQSAASLAAAEEQAVAAAPAALANAAMPAAQAAVTERAETQVADAHTSLDV